MTGRQYFVLGMTFVTGMFVGFYLYVTSFAPSYQTDTVQSPTEVEFLLQGRKVGGCASGGAVCPAFELRADRTYSYLPQSSVDSVTRQEVSGTYGKDAFETLVEYVDAIDLEVLQERSDHECSPLYDTNYRYNLTYKGKSYQYDTCNTVFKESILATKFYPLWTRLATTTPTAPLLEDGLVEFLRKQLDTRFSYDD